MVKKGFQTVAEPIASIFILPRALWAPYGAMYISATINFMEGLIRDGTVPSYFEGKRRVIDRLELDKYTEKRNAEAKAEAKAKAESEKK